MKFSFGCKRFHRLFHEFDNSELSPSDQRFMDRHRADCPDCRRLEESSCFALNMLRSAALEPVVSDSFDERVIRKLKVTTVKESLSYWSPALVGAGIACVAIFAALQIAATPVQLKRATLPDGEVKRELGQNPALPSLILEDKPRLDQ